MAKQKCYLASANTSIGFVSYIDYVLRDAERIYILKGGPGCGKSTFMLKIGDELLKFGLDVDIIYCGDEGSSIDGILIKDIGVAIVDGSRPNMIEPKYPGAVERILNFGDFWEIDYLRKERAKIKYYFDEMSLQYKRLYETLKQGKIIHDKLEQEYLLGMDFKKANLITDNLISEIIKFKKGTLGREWHGFAGAMVPEGQLCFYNNLTENITNRYVVKGRPGSGKSTMTKKIARTALEAGYDVEYYHCAFDPDSIDMVIIPEISFAILDGTSPHIFEPGKNDKLIDMFECIDKNVVNEQDNPIIAIEGKYKEEINKAKDIFLEISKLREILKKYYIEATDFNEVDALRNRILNALKGLKVKTGR